MLTGLHSDAATWYEFELSHAPKASPRAESRETLRLLFTRQQGPNRTRICYRLRAIVAASRTPSGPGCRCMMMIALIIALGEIM